nr:PREDICTED: mitochondrial enolase superfamily member 1-like isoform X2 [Megachile rotundata]
MEIIITEIDVTDIRFPTSLLADGSDAMHTDPDYSCAYVTIKTNKGIEGYGLTFTLGRGTEIDRTRERRHSSCYSSYSERALGSVGSNRKETCVEATYRFNSGTTSLYHRFQIHVRCVFKKFLIESLCRFRSFSFRVFHSTDVITKEEAIKLLKDNESGKVKREETLRKYGYPAYTTQVGWLGYSDSKVKELCKKFLSLGFTSFKAKVGQNLKDDIRRCRMIRETIGYDNKLMLDANQVWDVNESIEWMKELLKFKPTWIEEPTSPDDVLGHAKIAAELRPYGVGVATGEMCANRVMFKQLLQAKAIDYCQIDSARIGGINEILAVYLMAKKLQVPVCPHAGGVGLCEMVQHLQMWDFISLSASTENRVIEYIDQQHEHFEHPVRVQNACYMPPDQPGYSTKFKDDCVRNYSYPDGEQWRYMYDKGLFQ